MSDAADRDRDYPLCCSWRPIDADAYEALSLPRLRAKAAAVARTQIITESYVIGRADPESWISYSRRREFYVGRSGRYWPAAFTYDAVVPVVDQLAAGGLLDHEIAPPGRRGSDWRRMDVVCFVVG